MSKKNYKVTLSNFNLIDDKLPELFQSCIMVKVDGSIDIGMWDTSHSAQFKDSKCKNGSFSDGMGGHCPIESILAWIDVNDAKVEIVDE